MDLISREAVVATIEKRDDRLKKHKIYRDKGGSIDLLGVLPEIRAISSAFEGMTNGEVIKALFPNMKVYEYTEKVVLSGLGNEFQIQSMAWKTWWNRPYQKGGET